MAADDEYSIEELVQRNSHDLTALLLLNERRDRRHEQERHAAELAYINATLDFAQRIGVQVLRAERQGRKTVRIDDVVVLARAEA